MIQVIILAAGSISGKFGFLRSRCSSPALIPVNTRPLAAYLLDFYLAQKNCRLHLVVNEDVAATVRAELGMLAGSSALCALRQSTGVVDSLRQTVSGLSASDEVIVNLVTTVPTRMIQPSEVFIDGKTGQTGHWSGVLLQDGAPTFSFKARPLPTPNHAFTGIFRCRVDALQTALGQPLAGNDLLAVVAAVQTEQPFRFTAIDWIDCGHEINYYEAKAKLVSSRSFNRVQVSLEDGVLQKSSSHAEKLEREIDYVALLPAEIQVYFPRILARQPATALAPASVRMEYYGYPTVAEYFLYWELSPENWRRLFSRLEGVLKRFHRFPASISLAATEEFYLTKTTQRLEQFFASWPAAERTILTGELSVNGRACRPFAALKDELQRKLKDSFDAKDFCVMHGDFCFNNILYDVPSGIVRLIDPRGSFGEGCVGIYGDARYDLAKLQHSAVHGYDFLVNGLFTLKQTGRELNYTLATRECAGHVAALASELAAHLGHAQTEIDLLTSLLFLSMTPLHAEDKSRQLAMYAHGLHLLNTSLEN